MHFSIFQSFFKGLKKTSGEELMGNIRESDLPGIGRKFEIYTRSGDKLAVIVHDDGRRELYHFKYENPDESISMVTLDDDEARNVAGIIGGIKYRPKLVDSTEIFFDDLVVDWLRVDGGAASAGKTIGELQIRKKTGATIVAVLEKSHKKVINPGPEQFIREGDVLVILGEQDKVNACKRLIFFGELNSGTPNP